MIEAAIPARFDAPAFGTPGAVFQTAACVSRLQTAVLTASVEYAPRGMTPSDEDYAAAVELAHIAADCPQARLRIIGQHSADPQVGEDGSTGGCVR